ncbi:hypothetical protein MRX96_002108 [Rhipicephalus microplus]
MPTSLPAGLTWCAVIVSAVADESKPNSKHPPQHPARFLPKPPNPNDLLYTHEVLLPLNQPTWADKVESKRNLILRTRPEQNLAVISTPSSHVTDALLKVQELSLGQHTYPVLYLQIWQPPDDSCKGNFPELEPRFRRAPGGPYGTYTKPRHANAVLGLATHRAAAYPPESAWRFKFKVRRLTQTSMTLGTGPSPESAGTPSENTKYDHLYERRSFLCERRRVSRGRPEHPCRPSTRAAELIGAAARSPYNCAKDQATSTPSIRRI